MKTAIVDRIGERGADVSAIVDELDDAPELIAEVIEGLEAKTGRAKFGCAKALVVLSERHPEVLYPHSAACEKLLGAENRIIQWNAIRIIGNLASVDTRGRVRRIMDKYLGLITGSEMITAANAIAGAAKIALAKPKLVDKVIGGILKVETAAYKTAECRNVAIGHAIKALGCLGDAVLKRTDVGAFLKRQAGNSRNATRKKARELLAKLEKASTSGAAQRTRNRAACR